MAVPDKVIGITENRETPPSCRMMTAERGASSFMWKDIRIGVITGGERNGTKND